MTKPTQADLISALNNLADALERNPSPIVGMRVSVTGGGPGSGPVTGLSVSVTGGPGSGNVTGMRVSVNAGPGQRNAAEVALIEEIRSAVLAVQQGNANPSWVKGLFTRALDIGTAAIKGVVEAGAPIAVAYFSA